MSALEALALAKAAGVDVFLEDGKLIAVAVSLPADVHASLKAAGADIKRLLAARQAAEAALAAAPPDGCAAVRPVVGVRRWPTYDADGVETVRAKLVRGAPESRWAIALAGLERFLAEGWGDTAVLLGWTPKELYRAPPLWARVDLTGAALLVGAAKVAAVTADSIVVEATAGSRLKFRRIGREHLA
jgi:hypothetical protein